MSWINNDTELAARTEFDIIVVGGGIHGVMLTLEASLRGLSTLLLEKEDFGGATSFNSLRIIHGGFRYLQTADLTRLLDSARERCWYLKHFPHLAQPMPCLMPLYGEGLRRPWLLRPALAAYHRLTAHFNLALPPSHRIPPGRLLSVDETLAACRLLRREGLRGGALWYDAFMPDSHRILIGALRWACANGAVALNYTRASELLTRDGRVMGVRATDYRDQPLTLSGRCVVNAAGPWCREVAAGFHRDFPHLFRPMAAWNILYDRPAVSTHGLAVSPPVAGGHTYFAVPWKGRLLVGTGQSPWTIPSSSVNISPAQIAAFTQDVNRALPALDLQPEEVLDVFPGLQSAKRDGGRDFSKSNVFVDHSQYGGPKGLFSISGIKFTTSRRVAEQALNRIFPQRRHTMHPGERDFYRPPDDMTDPALLFPYDWRPPTNDLAWLSPLQRNLTLEAVRHLDDLVVRRTNLGDNPPRALDLAAAAASLLNGGAPERQLEIRRLSMHYARRKPSSLAPENHRPAATGP